MVCALGTISDGNLRSVSLTLADIVGIFEDRYDPAWAEPWDAVGLVCGDPEAEIRRVFDRLVSRGVPPAGPSAP